MSKDLFKKFVRLHPELGNSVMDNKTSWQKLYELYEMYGEESNVWDKYISTNKIVEQAKTNETSFGDLINMIRNVDLESVQKGVNNLQKTIGLLQDIGIGTKTKTPNILITSSDKNLLKELFISLILLVLILSFFIITTLFHLYFLVSY